MNNHNRYCLCCYCCQYCERRHDYPCPNGCNTDKLPRLAFVQIVAK